MQTCEYVWATIQKAHQPRTNMLDRAKSHQHFCIIGNVTKIHTVTSNTEWSGGKCRFVDYALDLKNLCFSDVNIKASVLEALEICQLIKKD